MYDLYFIFMTHFHISYIQKTENSGRAGLVSRSWESFTANGLQMLIDEETRVMLIM